MLKLIPATFEHALKMFPDYTREMFPDSVPEGFPDNSWCNDTCPSIGAMFGDSLAIQVWFEMPEPARREWEGAGRYAITLSHMAANVDTETVLETEEWADVLAWFDVSDFDSVISTPIVSHGGLFRFIRCLIAHKALFHFEDSPESIIWETGPVTPEHFPALAARVAEAYGLKGWHRDCCPIGMALDMGATEAELIDAPVSPAPISPTPPSASLAAPATVPPVDTLESLIVEYRAWLDSDSTLPDVDVDELELRLSESVFQAREGLKAEESKLAKVRDFAARWEAMETRRDFARKVAALSK